MRLRGPAVQVQRHVVGVEHRVRFEWAANDPGFGGAFVALDTFPRSLLFGPALGAPHGVAAPSGDLVSELVEFCIVVSVRDREPLGAFDRHERCGDRWAMGPPVDHRDTRQRVWRTGYKPGSRTPPPDEGGVNRAQLRGCPGPML